MSGWQQIRRQVAVVGRVIDAESRRPLPGVRITISAAPAAFTSDLAVRSLQDGAQWAALDERPDRTRTRADGRFHFLDLPDGQYTFTATWPELGSRYGSATGQATVTRNSSGKIALATTEIALPSTTLKGRITGRNNEPVVLAEVRLKAQAVQTRSDDQGNYLLTALEAGRHTVLVSAQGYTTKETAIDCQPSLAQTLNITL